MARARIKTARNPNHPYKSVISDRPGRGKNGVDLIDIGAPPIPRYGLIYITNLEAAQIAEHIGWIDGEIVREKLAELEADNRALRAQQAALPLAINEATERFKDGLLATAGAVAAGYNAALGAVPVADPGDVPAWAAAVPAAAELDSGRSAEDLALIDDGHGGDAEDDIGGQPVGDGGAADGGTGVDDPADAGTAEPDDGGAPAAAVDGGAAEPAARSDGAVDHPPARITDIAADYND